MSEPRHATTQDVEVYREWLLATARREMPPYPRGFYAPCCPAVGAPGACGP